MAKRNRHEQKEIHRIKFLIEFRDRDSENYTREFTEKRINMLELKIKKALDAHKIRYSKFKFICSETMGDDYTWDEWDEEEDEYEE